MIAIHPILDQNDSEKHHSFGSDTDNEPGDSENDTGSPMFDFDSQITDIGDEAFWTDDIENIDFPDFTEPTDPKHNLPPDTRPLQYFLFCSTCTGTC